MDHFPQINRAKKICSMKQYLLPLLLLSSQLCRAANYYFSSSAGDDARSNLQAHNPATPWKSLNKLNTVFSTLNPGDSVLLKRGDVFFGSITAAKSGTNSLPIVVSAYGQGSKPVITGLVNLSNWVSAGNGIWESSNSALATTLNTVVLNGVPQELGRYPNSNAANKGYLTLESHTNNTSITDNQLPASPNWTGAEVVIRKTHWILDRHLITNHSGQTITYNTGSSGYSPQDNFGYFIQNSKQTLDKFGEWYYNPSGKKMSIYFGSNSPSSYTIKASAVDTLVRVPAQSNVVFDNLYFEGANTNAFSIFTANNIKINNCDIVFSGRSGVFSHETNSLIIQNNTVTYCNDNGLDLRNSNERAIIRNNKISNIGLMTGLGANGDGHGIGIFTVGNSNDIECNQIINVGYIGISFGEDNTVVKNNFINNFCSVKDDGGGIYTFTGQSSNTTNYGRKVIGNIILNGIGAGEGTLSASHKLAHGIMFDDNVTGVEVTGNTVANISNNGIFLQYSRQISIRNNTVFNAGTQLRMSYGYTATAPISGNQVFSNILFPKSPSQTLSSFATNTKEINFGKFDSNYYCSPIGEGIGILNAYSNGAGGTIENAYDLAGWQNYKKEDYNAKTSPVKFPEFTVKSLIGANKFVNGNFNTDISGITVYSSANNCVKTFNSGGVLDGGCLQISFSNTNPGTALVSGSIGSIASKKYVLKYSLKGSIDNVTVGIYLRQANSPFTNLTAPQYRKISSTRTENQVLFYFPPATTAATVVFKIDNPNVKFWLDNIQFYEVDADVTNPDDYIRFEYNETPTNKTVALNGTYVDAKNNSYSNSVVIQPYSSVVLLKKSQTTTKTNQTITFSPIPAKTYGNPPFTVKATASSGLPVSFRIASGPAAVSHDTVFIKGAGTVVVEASQAGNATYNAATPVQQSFTVAKANQTITFPAIGTKAYGDPLFKLKATASSGLTVGYRIVSGPATVSHDTVQITGVGTVVVEASQPGSSNYNAASSVQQSFAVTKGNQTINFPPIPDKKFGDPPFDVSATASTGLAITFRIVSGPAIVNGNKVTLTGVGTVVIEAAQKGNEYYNPAAVQNSFAVRSPLARSSNVATQSSPQPAASVDQSSPSFNSITAYPNPFKDFATVQVYPTETGYASVDVYDWAGRIVKQLFKGTLEAGTPRSFQFKSDGLLDGVYVIKVISNTGVMTKKIVLSK
jgi:parallel beta-helix repeat protein